MEAREHLDRRPLCADCCQRAWSHAPWTRHDALDLRILVRQNPRPSRLAISPLTLRSRPRRPPVRPMRSESTPSLDFDRFARFAMTPLPKFNADNHLSIQRRQTTLAKMRVIRHK